MDEKPKFLDRPYGFFSSKSSALIFIGTVFLIFPIALFLWFLNVTVSFVISDDANSREEMISLSRWLVSIAIPISFVIYGLKKGSVNYSGAIFGLVVGFILAISSYPYLACLVAFFLIGSRATKYRSDVKKKFEANFKPSGNRNWVQVLCNCGPSTFFALLYMMDCGIGEEPMDFNMSYHSTCLSMCVLGSFAAACGDTLSSELGSVTCNKPVLITTLKPVPRGTNGGVSIQGLLFSLLGGIFIGISFYCTLVYCVDETLFERAPAQWPIILVGGFAGLIGSIIDSLIGAIFQYSGMHKDSGIIYEHPGKDIVHISGRKILDNHSVNLLCTLCTGLLTPPIANALYR